MAAAIAALGVLFIPVYYLGRGRDQVSLTVRADARLILLGGEPFGERILMWWNFVARTPEEIAEARSEWEQEHQRFGNVRAYAGGRIPAPPLNLRLQRPEMTRKNVHPLTGEPAPASLLVNVPRLVTASYVERPDPSYPGATRGVRDLGAPRIFADAGIQRGAHPGDHPVDLSLPEGARDRWAAVPRLGYQCAVRACPGESSRGPRGQWCASMPPVNTTAPGIAEGREDAPRYLRER